jgi:hypothetical protein
MPGMVNPPGESAFLGEVPGGGSRPVLVVAARAH